MKNKNKEKKKKRTNERKKIKQRVKEPIYCTYRNDGTSRYT